MRFAQHIIFVFCPYHFAFFFYVLVAHFNSSFKIFKSSIYAACYILLLCSILGSRLDCSCCHLLNDNNHRTICLYKDRLSSVVYLRVFIVVSNTASELVSKANLVEYFFNRRVFYIGSDRHILIYLNKIHSAFDMQVMCSV